jgi:hypothetical protein
MGQLARVRMQYDRPEPGAPAWLIAKFPTYAPENRAIADLFRFYEIETRFYEELAPKVEIRTPRRYYSARASDSTDFILLMEDLAPARVGDNVAGCSARDAELPIRELAKFHATWWESPELQRIDWLWPFNHSVREQGVGLSYRHSWGPFVQNWGKRVPAPLLEMGEVFPDKLPKLLARLAARPVTITHGDYRLDNMFFGTADGAVPFAIVDWQIISAGNGLFDVAYFLANGMRPEDRRAAEMDLLRMYHGILVERGVRDYDFDRCLLDYRTAALFCWQYAVVILGALDSANERGMALFSDILDRFVSAITDLSAAELLPS